MQKLHLTQKVKICSYVVLSYEGSIGIVVFEFVYIMQVFASIFLGNVFGLLSRQLVCIFPCCDNNFWLIQDTYPHAYIYICEFVKKYFPQRCSNCVQIVLWSLSIFRDCWSVMMIRYVKFRFASCCMLIFL